MTSDQLPLEELAKHADVGVTQKHYAYLLKENLREAADRIDLGLGLPKPAKVVAIDRSRRV